MALPDRRSSPVDNQPEPVSGLPTELLELRERYRLFCWTGISTAGLMLVTVNPSEMLPIVVVIALLVLLEATIRLLRRYKRSAPPPDC